MKCLRFWGLVVPSPLGRGNHAEHLIPLPKLNPSPSKYNKRQSLPRTWELVVYQPLEKMEINMVACFYHYAQEIRAVSSLWV